MAVFRYPYKLSLHLSLKIEVLYLLNNLLPVYNKKMCDSKYEYQSPRFYLAYEYIGETEVYLKYGRTV